MNCPDVRQMLWQHLSRELPPAQAAEVEAHIASCPACRKELGSLSSLVKELPKPPEKPDAYWEAYTEEVAGRLHERPFALRLPSLKWAYALGVILAFLGGGLYYRLHQTVPVAAPVEEVVKDLDVLQNLDILEREDFDDLVRPS